MCARRFVCLFAVILVTLPTGATSDGIIEDSDEEGEIEQKVRMLSATAKFNRVSFAGAVLERDRIFTEHWIVKFCVDWYSPCTGEFLETYQSRSADIERQYNSGIGAFDPRVIRFVEVDCGSDKVLCNEEQVGDYPTLVHYHRGEPISKWTSGGRAAKMTEKSVQWVNKRLGCLRVGDDALPAECVSTSSLASESDEEAATRAARSFMNAIVFVCLFVSLAWSIIKNLMPLLRMRAASDKATELSAAEATPDLSQTRSCRALPREWGEARCLEL